MKKQDRHLSTVDSASVDKIEGRRAGLLLICEHAGREVPSAWGCLGLNGEYFNTHFAYDVGAAELTRAIGVELGVPAILARYSRLFYDINRGARSWDCIRPDMGGIPVPGNLDISEAERDLRDRLTREPFDRAVLDCVRPGDLIANIHSFSAVYDGKIRKTEIGVLHADELGKGQAMLDWLRRDGRFRIGDNEPYDLRKVAPGTASRIQARCPVDAVILEVRNDLIATAEGVLRVAACLAEGLDTLAVSDVETRS